MKNEKRKISSVNFFHHSKQRKTSAVFLYNIQALNLQKATSLSILKSFKTYIETFFHVLLEDKTQPTEPATRSDMKCSRILKLELEQSKLLDFTINGIMILNFAF